MNLAILFWFYKEPEICKNHLELLKKYNPNIKIFGLFGGEAKDAKFYQETLENYLDDSYISPFNDPHWKWINGDLMIFDWFVKRGVSLPWDSIAVVQWDMLIFDSLDKVFPNLEKNQIFLSGLRVLDDEIDKKWKWTKQKENRKNYLSFLDYVKKNYQYKELPYCCLFILEIFPKIFFEKYGSVKNKEIGMLEYRIPIYAKIFGIPFYEKDIGVWWFSEKNKTPLNARGNKINKDYILEQLNKKHGWRIFHPYRKFWI